MDLRQLSDIERGVLLGALLSDAPADHRLQHLSCSPRCRRLYTDLQRCGHDQRLIVTRQLMTQVLSPLPIGLERVHPSWIAQLLEGESAAVVALVLGVMPASVSEQLQPASATITRSTSADVDPMLRRQLCRWLLGRLQPMVLDEGDELLDWSARRISDALISVGCVAVAAVAGRAGLEVIDRLAARLGAPFDQRLRRAARCRPPWATWTPLALLSDGQVARPRQLLLRTGCGVFGATASRAACQAIAQRLPVDHLAAPLLAAQEDNDDSAASAAMLIAADRWTAEVEI